jgi:very-short-patch-repair endonuclease
VVKEQTVEGRLHDAKYRNFAKRLRRDQTDAESVFWYNVRSRRLAGFKFKRRYPVAPYIVDFVCIESKLIVKLDGGQHAIQWSYDEKRTEFLETRGYRVLRFWNDEILKNRDGVLETVLRALRNVDTPSP